MVQILDIDSGGGSVDAIAPLVDAIRRSRAAGKAGDSKLRLMLFCCLLCGFHAAYEIVANNNISAEFGSIGVMMSFRDYAEKFERWN